jgi:hypothetical protein
MIKFVMHWWFHFYVPSSISFTHWFHENTLMIVVIPLVLISNHYFGFKTMVKLLLAQMFGRITIGFIDCLNGMVFNICYSNFSIVICTGSCTVGNDFFAWVELAPPPSHILSLILSPILGHLC